MLDPHWILNFRSDALTLFFKYIPVVANGYLYIMVIVVGYCLRPSAILFRALGFLIPFSALAILILKNTIRIPRPDQALHLIAVHDPFGFPSGEVTIATVFWATLAFSLQTKLLRYLCGVPILCIMLSRVYLGVHSIYDIFGGLIVGCSIIYLWKKYLENKLLGSHSQKHPKLFWFLCIAMVMLYMLIYKAIS